MDISRIVIKGSSGYCSYDEVYNDKITITPVSIEYEYIPMKITDINPVRNWKYKTNSPIFKMTYARILEKISLVTDFSVEEICTDLGIIEFNITYSDKTKFKRKFCCSSNAFTDLFKEIKSMVPECEYIPAVLLTDEDYEDE